MTLDESIKHFSDESSEVIQKEALRLKNKMTADEIVQASTDHNGEVNFNRLARVLVIQAADNVMEKEYGFDTMQNAKKLVKKANRRQV